MLKKTFLILVSIVLFASCLKKEEVMKQYEYQIELDAQTIELFFRTNKVVYDADTASLEDCGLDDAACMWNQRLGGDGVLKKGTPYSDLLGKVFKDTILQQVITEEDLDGNGYVDTLMLETGTWIYISNLGDGARLPTDSSYVMARYAGYLVDKSMFDVNGNGMSFSLGQSDYIGGSSIVGFRNGLMYFQPGVLSERDVDDGEGGITQEQYWKNPGAGWIFIPSRSAYGNVYHNPLPPNAVLVFQIASLAIADMPGTVLAGEKAENIKWFKAKD